eukprot:scaffold3542_cov41-Attheya_sp.AAC.1
MPTPMPTANLPVQETPKTPIPTAELQMSTTPMPTANLPPSDGAVICVATIVGPFDGFSDGRLLAIIDGVIVCSIMDGSFEERWLRIAHVLVPLMGSARGAWLGYWMAFLWTSWMHPGTVLVMDSLMFLSMESLRVDCLVLDGAVILVLNFCRELNTSFCSIQSTWSDA